VLDLTHVLAGPFCTFQLATLGAEVIKIESPTRPDMTREEGVAPQLNDDLLGTYFMGQAAGKKSLPLDLSTERGRAVFERLVKTADVLVQNYAGEALDRFDLGYERVAQISPKLIYVSMSGFGQTGPKAGHPAYDIIIQAWTGLMATNGWNGEDPRCSSTSGLPIRPRRTVTVGTTASAGCSHARTPDRSRIHRI